jgi:hypothetical protein
MAQPAPGSLRHVQMHQPPNRNPFSAAETKTRDNVFVTLLISVQYQVNKESTFDAFYRLSDSRQQISSYVFDTVRSTGGGPALDKGGRNVHSASWSQSSSCAHSGASLGPAHLPASPSSSSSSSSPPHQAACLGHHHHSPPLPLPTSSAQDDPG